MIRQTEPLFSQIILNLTPNNHKFNSKARKTFETQLELLFLAEAEKKRKKIANIYLESLLQQGIGLGEAMESINKNLPPKLTHSNAFLKQDIDERW